MVADAAPGGGQAPVVAVVAVDDMSLEIGRGEFVCVVGPSGCGKSTILNLVAGLEQASSGRVETGGVEVSGPGPDRGVMFQDYALYPWRTVEGNIGFGLAYGSPGANLSKAERRERVGRLIDLVSRPEAAEFTRQDTSDLRGLPSWQIASWSDRS